MELIDSIVADLRTAMKNRDEGRKAVLRSLKAAFDKEAIDSGKELDEKAALAVVRRAHKQRREAAEAYREGGSEDRAAAELQEAEVIGGYLPAQLDAAAVERHIDETIAAVGAAAPGDQGKVMGKLAAVLGGKADMKEVASAVRAKLAG